ncbi:MAG: helix-turn-helix transcriptional regulator [Myxococcales bacterium]
MLSNGGSGTEPLAAALIGAAYAAAQGEATWAELIASVAQATGHDHGLIARVEGDERIPVVLGAHAVPPDCLQQLPERLRAGDPVAVGPETRSERRKAVGAEVMRLDARLTEELLEDSVLYQRHMRPHGITVRGALRVNLRDGDTRGALCLFRQQASPTTERGDAEQLLQALAPHLDAALRLQRRLQAQRTLAEGLLAALDRLPHGVLLVDCDGRLLGASRRSRRVLEADDGLRLDGDRLSARDPQTRQALTAALSERGGDASEDDASEDGARVLRIDRGPGRRPYELLVCPVRDGSIVYVCDPDQRGDLSTEAALRAGLGLTRRESQVALGVLDGENIQEIAQRLGLGRETVKTHLAGVYGKTDCRCQPELVRRLLLGVAALQGP